MPIDPEELKIEGVKRHSQVQYVQKYMDEQDALEKANAAGKLGSNTVKKETFMRENIASLVKRVWHHLFD